MEMVRVYFVAPVGLFTPLKAGETKTDTDIILCPAEL